MTLHLRGSPMSGGMAPHAGMLGEGDPRCVSASAFATSVKLLDSCQDGVSPAARLTGPTGSLDDGRDVQLQDVAIGSQAEARAAGVGGVREEAAADQSVLGGMLVAAAGSDSEGVMECQPTADPALVAPLTADELRCVASVIHEPQPRAETPWEVYRRAHGLIVEHVLTGKPVSCGLHAERERGLSGLSSSQAEAEMRVCTSIYLDSSAPAELRGMAELLVQQLSEQMQPLKEPLEAFCGDHPPPSQGTGRPYAGCPVAVECEDVRSTRARWAKRLQPQGDHRLEIDQDTLALMA